MKNEEKCLLGLRLLHRIEEEGDGDVRGHNRTVLHHLADHGAMLVSEQERRHGNGEGRREQFKRAVDAGTSDPLFISARNRSPAERWT